MSTSAPGVRPARVTLTSVPTVPLGGSNDMVPEDWPSAAPDRLKIKTASKRAKLRGALRRSGMRHLSEAARRGAGPQGSIVGRGRRVRAGLLRTLLGGLDGDLAGADVP